MFPIILLVLGLLLVFIGPHVMSLFGKELFIRRVNPEGPNKYGDLSYKDRSFVIKTLPGNKYFAIDQLQQIRVFTEVDYGLSEYDMAELTFPGYRIFITLSASYESKAFLEDLVTELNVKNVLPFNWGFLPMSGNTSKEGIIYTKEPK